MKLRLLSLFAVLFAAVGASAQGALDFKINEVYVHIPAADSLPGYQDEYGEKGSWIEILNTSYSTRKINSCYITSDRTALDETLTAPERMAKMWQIPGGDPRTTLTAKQRITFFADGNDNRSILHANFKLEPGKENFIALYDGNAITLIDTVTVPALPAGHSYARVYDKEADAYIWVEAAAKDVTPDAPNDVNQKKEDKLQEWKDNDPYGVAMAIISMGIVFFCLLLLYGFFHAFGWIMANLDKLTPKPIRKMKEGAGRLVVMAKDATTETKGIEMENYVAAIGMALHEYYGGTHDIESDVLTIHHDHYSSWDNKDHAMRQNPLHHVQNPSL